VQRGRGYGAPDRYHHGENSYHQEFVSGKGLINYNGEQGACKEALSDTNHPRMPEARQEKSIVITNNGSATKASPTSGVSTMGDNGTLPSNAMALVKQLLAAIAKKGAGEGEVPGETGDTMPIDKM
jgi:hypothetical protein